MNVKAEKKLYWRLVLLFGVGNLVFANALANLAGFGFWGLPLGIGVSGSLTICTQSHVAEER